MEEEKLNHSFNQNNIEKADESSSESSHYEVEGKRSSMEMDIIEYLDNSKVLWIEKPTLNNKAWRSK